MINLATKRGTFMKTEQIIYLTDIAQTNSIKKYAAPLSLKWVVHSKINNWNHLSSWNNSNPVMHGNSFYTFQNQQTKIFSNNIQFYIDKSSDLLGDFLGY